MSLASSLSATGDKQEGPCSSAAASPAASLPDGDGTNWESEKITFRPRTRSAATNSLLVSR